MNNKLLWIILLTTNVVFNGCALAFATCMLVYIAKQKLKVNMITTLLLFELAKNGSLFVAGFFFWDDAAEYNHFSPLPKPNKIKTFIALTCALISIGLKNWVFSLKIRSLSSILKQIVENKKNEKKTWIALEVFIYYSAIVLSILIPLSFLICYLRGLFKVT